MQVTAPVLRALGVRDADAWAASLSPACARHGITTRLRLAAFLANVLHETGGFSALVENLNYTPEALLRTWPAHFGPENAYRLGRTADHPADQYMIAELAYGGRMGNGKPGTGDGWLYRGRGLIQLTGKSNYQAFSDKTGIALADLPMLLQMPAGAAESAANFWQATGCNEVADRGDIAAVRRIVNGGFNGLADVQSRYRAALAALGSPGPAPPPVQVRAAPAPHPAPKPAAPDELTAEDLNAAELERIRS